MAAQLSILARIKTLNHRSIKSISTFTFLSQEPLLAEDSSTTATPLPPNPATGSPIYKEHWRNPNPFLSTDSVVPLGLATTARLQSIPNPDLNSLLNMFADWVTSQRWSDMKRFFEFWIRSLDKYGKPNKPDVNLYNLYLRANLMTNATAGDLLDLVAKMEEFSVSPNTASFNLVLKAMFQARETEAAEKLLQRMEMTGKESQPDNESYDLFIGMLLLADQTDAALKYIYKTLKNGYMLSNGVFTECIKNCIRKGRLDILVSIIGKCKTMDQNKALYPPWKLCNFMAEVALQHDKSELAYYALEFMARWIARGEFARPAVRLFVDERLVVSALGTASRTYSATLLDASWAILRRSLRDEKAPNPESFIGKINAYASLGNLQRAFSTLREFESAYKNADKKDVEEFFSPFTSLNPLVVACSKKGFETLDLVYFQLENLSRAEQPYRSVTALNCIILGCANIWDLDRAYQTFEAISSSFWLIPNIHSYNALMHAFGRLKKTFEAARVFEHLRSLGIKPNGTSYSLLVDAHLINRDAKTALSVLEEMVSAGFVPTRETLKKARRRCIREMDYDTDDRVEALAKRFNIRMGVEDRSNVLFNLEYSTTEYA